jgi:biopolymer transport protein ExbD
VSEQLTGRRVRCPQCDELVEVVPIGGGASVSAPADEGTGGPRDGGDRVRATTVLVPPRDTGSETVMLEAVDIVIDRPPAATVPADRPPPARRKTAAQESLPPPTFRKTRLVETELDMTPMVDVTFQMLIFFMITAALALQKAKEIPKPQSDEPSPNVVVRDDQTQDRVIVRIDEFNTFTVINLDGDEEEAPSVHDLYVRLRRAKTGGSGGQVPTKLRVEAHGEALHERVVAALDAGNETGFAELELATTPEDLD